jgi:hypothetical protein
MPPRGTTSSTLVSPLRQANRCSATRSAESASQWLPEARRSPSARLATRADVSTPPTIRAARCARRGRSRTGKRRSSLRVRPRFYFTVTQTVGPLPLTRCREPPRGQAPRHSPCLCVDIRRTCSSLGFRNASRPVVSLRGRGAPRHRFSGWSPLSRPPPTRG